MDWITERHEDAFFSVHGHFAGQEDPDCSLCAPTVPSCKCGHHDWAHDGLGCIECGCRMIPESREHPHDYGYYEEN